MKLEPASLYSLDGKVAIVTGGGRGLGRSIAEGLAAAGADVVIASRTIDNCERAAAEVGATTGRRTLAVGSHWATGMIASASSTPSIKSSAAWTPW